MHGWMYGCIDVCLQVERHLNHSKRTRKRLNMLSAYHYTMLLLHCEAEKLWLPYHGVTHQPWQKISRQSYYLVNPAPYCQIAMLPEYHTTIDSEIAVRPHYGTFAWMHYWIINVDYYTRLLRFHYSVTLWMHVNAAASLYDYIILQRYVKIARSPHCYIKHRLVCQSSRTLDKLNTR